MVDNKKPLPDQQYLQDILDYNSDTGIFLWRKRPDYPRKWNTRYAGKQAGCLCHGYRQIRIDGQSWQAARLAWMMVYGYDPNVVDFKNNKGDDLRLCNLRDATDSAVMWNQNQRASQKHGKGIHQLENGTYVVHITYCGKMSHVGTFGDLDDAKRAYNEAAVTLFGEFAVLNDVSGASGAIRKRVLQRNPKTGQYNTVEICV